MHISYPQNCIFVSSYLVSFKFILLTLIYFWLPLKNWIEYKCINILNKVCCAVSALLCFRFITLEIKMRICIVFCIPITYDLYVLHIKYKYTIHLYMLVCVINEAVRNWYIFILYSAFRILIIKDENKE